MIEEVPTIETEPKVVVNEIEPITDQTDPISHLANLRRNLAIAKQKKQDMLMALENSLEYKSVFNEVKQTENMIESITGYLKDKYLSIAITDETGKVLNPNPHPAVTLKRFDATKLIYDGKKAFSWCLSNLSIVLDLNTKEFEKQAKSGKLPDDVVEVIDGWETRVQFATDLSKYETE